MDERDSADILLFEGFRFDRHHGGCLYRLDEAGVAEPVPLCGRGLALLGLLLERHGELVPKDEIMQVVWRGRVVEEANLNVQISKLRDILGQGCIQTVHGHGYRFGAPVTPPGTGMPSAIAPFLHDRAPPRPRLSIVVLPFADLSEDGKQQYFADGITGDLTTDLSRIEDIFVISHHTAASYRNKAVDIKQIGRELGVRYALEGSVRRSGNQVRVNAQLIDAETDAHLWAERFDCNSGGLFDVQNEISSRIAVALDLELVVAEAARPTDHPDALDYMLRGRAAIFSKPPADDAYAQAIALFERALALDPRSAEAQSWLAIALMHRGRDETNDLATADIARAEELVDRALAASPRSALAHYAKAQVLRIQRRLEDAIPEYETVLALNRSRVCAMSNLGWCKLLSGSLEEAIRLHEQAIRLSPRDPLIGVWLGRVGLAYLLQSRTDEAIVWLERARNANPELACVHSRLASAYALKAEPERAAGELAEARRASAEARCSNITRLKAAGDLGLPKIRALAESTYFAGLRLAGMPEE